jgi:hypothetical protein
MVSEKIVRLNTTIQADKNAAGQPDSFPLRHVFKIMFQALTHAARSFVTVSIRSGSGRGVTVLTKHQWKSATSDNDVATSSSKVFYSPLSMLRRLGCL